MDNFSVWQIVIIGLILTHVFLAFFGMLLISSIREDLLPKGNIYKILCWIIPYFGSLVLFKNGEYVPSIGSIEFSSALQVSQAESSGNYSSCTKGSANSGSPIGDVSAGHSTFDADGD